MSVNDPSISAANRVAEQNGGISNTVHRLTVVVAPAIGYAWVGDNVTITAKVSGTDPSGYQWYHDGLPIAGATQASIQLVNVQSSNSGSYTVMVTNAHGSDMGTSCLNVDASAVTNTFLTSTSSIPCALCVAPTRF